MTNATQLAIGRRITVLAAFATALLGSAAFVSPASADSGWGGNSHAPVACSSLAAIVARTAGSALNTNPVNPNTASFSISSTTPVTSKIIPAAAPNLAYCQVVFQLKPFITIEVGLPLNAIDGGTGLGCSNVASRTNFYGSTGAVNNTCVQGNWNGRIEAIGNGGYSGSVPGVTGATNLGFVGSSTDNGHSANWCNATNPATGETYAQAGCGTAGGGGGFVLDPNNNLLKYQVTDFIDTSEVDQTIWAKILAREYYGREHTRTYWNGCSTGGRQGMQMAQFHPEMFDGILAGAPAFNWNRFIPGSIWFPVVLADLDPADCPGGTAASCTNAGGASTAFANAYTAANAMAVADCDANDGVVDGVINEPRRCFFDAKSLIGQTIPPMTSPMTEAQALAINAIWDGPRNQRGQRLWGGVARGTSFAVELIYGLSLNASFPLYWVYQNPNFQISGTITTTNFAEFFQTADRKFADTTPPPPGFEVAAATDRTDLDALMDHGTKLIHYRGLADPLIIPFGSWNYDTRLLERYDLAKLQKYYRSFYYPGNGHCGGNTGGLFGGGNFPNAGLINGTDLFNALINWVENGTPPASITAYTQAADTGNTTLICPYPSYTSYTGSGPTTSASSYTCVPMSKEAPDLAAYDQTAKQYYEAP